MADFVAELTAKQDAISALTERAAHFLENLGVDTRAVHHMALVLDELLTHGGTIETPISIRLATSPECVTAEVVDGGVMFDPRVEQKPNTSANVQEHAVGGFGLLLVQRVSEGLSYERIEDRNRTTFSIRRATRG